jgi:hypothetical protein
MFHLREFAYLAVTWTLLSAHPATAQSPAKPADAKAIAALIAQLGSENFQERQAATRSLEAIGRPALAALREAADKNADAEVSRRAKGLVEKIENGLEQLLEDYKSYGLPVPNKDTPLVRFASGGGGIYLGVKQPLTYSLGFLLRPATKKESPEILRGSLRYRLMSRPAVTHLDPTKATAKDIDAWVADAENDLFFLAIQSKARGWDSLARTFFDRRPKEREDQTPRGKLRFEAWHYWQFELTRPETDWPIASRYMHVLIAIDKDLNTPDKKALLKSLDAALVPSKAKPGSIEALIDSLVDVRSTDLRFNDTKSDPRYLRLVKVGFEAVPELIKHLNDDRLTRIYYPPAMMSSGNQARVRDLVGELIEGLAGGGLPPDWIEDMNPAQARAWWERAKKVGEEEHVVASVLTEIRRQPNEVLLWLVSKKYSRHLPKLYHTVLDKPPGHLSGALADAIVGSDLPRERMFDLLTYGARHENKEHRAGAFGAIERLDRELFVEVVTKLLDELPRTPKGTYWRCPEEKVVYLVLDTEDARVWKALDKAARRVDVGLRMQILKRVGSGGNTNEHRPERLAFLKAFLDDATLRDVDSDPDKYVAVPAGDGFSKIEVRNYAAMMIAQLLKLERTPLPTWDDTQWAQFRDEVRQALKR